VNGLKAGVLVMAILLQGAGCRSARSCAAAYREAATWLEANALPQESIAVAEAAGRCFGERTVQTLPATTDALALLRAVDDGRPDYVLAEDGIAWDGAAAQPWFLARYRAVEAWHLGGTPARGSVLFAYTPTPTDGQPMVAAPARFLTDAVVLRGLRARSSRIGPDEPLHLTLLWDDVPGRPYQTLHVAVRLVDQATDTVWAHAAPPLVPAGVALEDEARLAQEVVLHPPESLPQGDYVVAVSLTEPSGRPVDVSGRAAAGGYGMALAAVTNPPDVSAQPIAMEYDVTATFGSADTPQIKLLGYDAPDRAAPGAWVRVALLWSASQAVSEDYHVLVHLVSRDNALVAQGDGVPVYGFFPTNTWTPGSYVRDEHGLALPEDLPRGDYEVYVGLYRVDTGERLEARDGVGTLQADGRVLLHRLAVR